MTIETLLAWLRDIASTPGLIPFALAGATFLLEDAATVAGALLASENLVSGEAAFAGLMVGIVLGDAGLYGLGHLARQSTRFLRLVRRLGLSEDREAKAQKLFTQTLVGTVFTTRFIPGMRLPTYLACGYLNVSFSKFMLCVVLASALWTGVVFWIVLTLGQSVLTHLGPWQIPAAIVIGAALVILPRIIMPRLMRGIHRIWKSFSPVSGAR